MPSYDYREYDDRDWSERYPADVTGASAWQEQPSGPDWSGFDAAGALRVFPKPGMINRPRIFVSHRRIDVAKAERIAWLADEEGFEFWLDALDFSIQQLVGLAGSGAISQRTRSLATAAIIEMALLNSTHVVAAMTSKTPGSAWVPYEYGRAKDMGPVSRQAGCWIERGLNLKRLPEYLHLGKKTFSEADIRRWFSTEFTHWNTRYGSSATAPAGNWHGTIPAPL